MKKTQILWNESKKNMLSISPYANIFVDRQGRIFCYRETLEKNIMISGMDYKCANELVEYLSVPITEDELRIKIIKLLGKDADHCRTCHYRNHQLSDHPLCYAKRYRTGNYGSKCHTVGGQSGWGFRLL